LGFEAIMSRGANRIDEERVCIDSLVQHLKGIDRVSTVVAEKEPNDPPDYWLSVGEQRFAVEITSIVTDQGYAAHCKFLHDAIKEQWGSDASITGVYIMEVFRTPDIPKRGSNKWKNLVTNAVAVINSMSGSPVHTEVILRQDQGGYLAMSKLSDEGSKVGWCLTPEAKREGEIRADLAGLLKKAVEKKHCKIQKKGIMDECPDVILLLYDAYGYGDIEDARQAFSNVEGYGWLHSIYWAASFSDRVNVLYPESPGRAGGFLYSRNNAWRQRA
jgi:hypothetical protein